MTGYTPQDNAALDRLVERSSQGAVKPNLNSEGERYLREITKLAEQINGSKNLNAADRAYLKEVLKENFETLVHNNKDMARDGVVSERERGQLAGKFNPIAFEGQELAEVDFERRGLPKMSLTGTEIDRLVEETGRLAGQSIMRLRSPDGPT